MQRVGVCADGRRAVAVNVFRDLVSLSPPRTLLISLLLRSRVSLLIY